MAKRIVTKIGDIFCIKIDDSHVRYFQYIANDFYRLNSSTIRVFKTNHPCDNKLSMDEIIADEVEFYSHTVLKFGIQDGLWQKVGKSSDVGSFDSIMFRSEGLDCIPPNFKSYEWYVWHLGEDSFFIGELTDYYAKATDPGSVFPPSWVVDRIKAGKWLCKLPY